MGKHSYMYSIGPWVLPAHHPWTTERVGSCRCHQPKTARDETLEGLQACGKQHRLQHLSPAQPSSAQLVSGQPASQSHTSLAFFSNPMLQVAPRRGVAVPRL